MGSLGFLRSHCTAPIDAADPPRTSTEQFLEDVNARLVHHLNAHDYAHPDILTYVAPNFCAYMEHTPEPIVTTRAQWLERFAAISRENPEYRFELLSMTASVDEEGRSAKLWYLMRIMGHPSGVVRESVTICTWKKRGKKWICVRQDGMRGLGPVT